MDSKLGLDVAIKNLNPTTTRCSISKLQDSQVFFFSPSFGSAFISLPSTLSCWETTMDVSLCVACSWTKCHPSPGTEKSIFQDGSVNISTLNLSGKKTTTKRNEASSPFSIGAMCASGCQMVSLTSS